MQVITLLMRYGRAMTQDSAAQDSAAQGSAARDAAAHDRAARDAAPRRRPGGRTARVGQAVHEAVRTLIAERGRDGFTGRDVAERAGVHEATIYRRWGNLDNLVLDVAVSVAKLNEDSPIPDTGSLRGDLLEWATAMADSLSRPGGLTLLGAVLAARTADTTRPETSRQVDDFLSARAVTIQQVLDRATGRGETAPDLTTVLDRLVAPLYLRATFGYCDVAHGLDDLVGHTLAGPAGGRSAVP